MKQSANDILSNAISDIGYWQWWDEANGDYMVEFGGVQLYDESKTGKSMRTSCIAICFYGNAFLVFLDNSEDTTNWFIGLHEDSLDPITFDADGLSINDKDSAVSLLTEYKRRSGPFDSREEAVKAIMNAEELMSATCGNYGFIIGGDKRVITGRNGDLTDNDIVRLFTKWWEYWKDYWKKRGTKEAYEEDYACEVTIPSK